MGVRDQAARWPTTAKQEGTGMQMRDFGRTGLKTSVFGFGCGNVGGLMVRGDPVVQERTVARALAVGINYFDTAVQYGNGVSETNLGRVWAKLKPNAIVGTKVRLTREERADIAGAVARSLDGSLKRLGMSCVDIFHLHNAITLDGAGESLSAKTVLEEVVPAFEKLRQQGKLRFFGITAIGDTGALHQVIDSGAFHSAQIIYNMLNPSAGTAVPAGYPAQDYDRLLDHALTAGVGTVGIRTLAGGALTGIAERHPIASPPPKPIGSALSYEGDLQRAQRFVPLVREGFAANLAELSTRFVISHSGIGTVLVGMATPTEFEQALTAVEKGKLPVAALGLLTELQRGFVGEQR
jgi:aryl-alcohol dehydrogenase-like predicted oxidoreductase